MKQIFDQRDKFFDLFEFNTNQNRKVDDLADEKTDFTILVSSQFLFGIIIRQLTH